MERYPNPGGTVSGRGAKPKPAKYVRPKSAKYVGPKPSGKRIKPFKPGDKGGVGAAVPKPFKPGDKGGVGAAVPKPAKYIGPRPTRTAPSKGGQKKLMPTKPQNPKLKHPSWAGSTTKPYASRPIKKRKIR